ncbi:hypothetical protein EJ377_07625 [Chryseobacterium arthrosphaerae]|uniref:Uncharacterized protein n=1 Tax=Chryseobacterium arthrosphaerae TaxID=651561 RepID=A0A432E027_9FLAO|nr:hypothetical protein EJ377_07625 [Chryseobacterium arthrosphaerae]
MKKSICILSLFAGFWATAQTGIDKTSGFGASSLLEFGSANNRGILLTPVTDVTAINATPGTIAFDGATGSFRYYNGSWSTVVPGGTTSGPLLTLIKQPGSHYQCRYINCRRVLILGKDSGETKGLVLPLVSAPELNIGNPPKGLMVYDTTNGYIKVYNGTSWTNF